MVLMLKIKHIFIIESYTECKIGRNRNAEWREKQQQKQNKKQNIQEVTHTIQHAH